MMPLKRARSLDLIADDDDITLGNEPFIDVRKKRKNSKRGRLPLSQPAAQPVPEDNSPPAAPLCELCPFCGENCDSSPAIHCEVCGHAHHLNCCGVVEGNVEAALAVVNLLGWTCKSCRGEMLVELRKLRSEVSELYKKIAEKKNMPEKIDDPVISGAAMRTNSPATSGSNENVTYAQIVRVVNKTVKDNQLRKRNIIVSGLAEQDGCEDRQIFSTLCEEHLNMKPRITNHNGTRRLGKVVADKPRRLLVRLESEAAAAELLRNACYLRKSHDNYIASSIYVNPDLSKEESKLAYERRQEKRQRVEVGDTEPEGRTSVRPNIRSEFNQGWSSRPANMASSSNGSIHRPLTIVNRSRLGYNTAQAVAPRNSSNLIICSNNTDRTAILPHIYCASNPPNDNIALATPHTSDPHVIGATVAPPNTRSTLNPCANVYLSSEDVATSYTAATNVASTSAAEPMA